MIHGRSRVGSSCGLQEAEGELVGDADDAQKTFVSFPGRVTSDFVVVLSSDARLPKRGGIRELDEGLVCFGRIQVLPRRVSVGKYPLELGAVSAYRC